MPGPPTTLHIQWSDDGCYLRKWALEPFAGSTPFTAAAPPASAADDATVDTVARALAKAHGLDFDEVCGLDAESGDDCDSSTCIAAWREDHDADLRRSDYRQQARAAIAAIQSEGA